jgi:hypothetical protein
MKYMKKLILKNLEEIKNNNTAKSFSQIMDAIDMNAIYFATWIDLLLKEDKEWFKHNSVSTTYILFKKWSMEDNDDE